MTIAVVPRSATSCNLTLISIINDAPRASEKNKCPHFKITICLFTSFETSASSFFSLGNNNNNNNNNKSLPLENTTSRAEKKTPPAAREREREKKKKRFVRARAF